MSPSSRGRGLKLTAYLHQPLKYHVALFTRAWIEIVKLSARYSRTLVALFTRAWIEIFNLGIMFLPTVVALFTRAWIEIELLQMEYDTKQGRPLHEGVD